MPHDAETQVLCTMFEPDAAGLLGLVQRTCQALQAMVTSLDALDNVLLRLQRLGPSTDPPTKLMAGTRDTVSRVVALLRQEGPPLLFRAQALRLRLRLHGQAEAGRSAVAMRMLHADLDALAAFQIGDAGHWGLFLRRIRANAMALLEEFEGQRRGMAASEPQSALVPRSTPPLMTAAR